MDYQKIYDDLIIKILLEHRIKLRKNQEGYVCYERHHIIPRCMHGPDIPENLLLTTDKEHYFFHKLLTYIFKGNREIAYAFHKMTYSKHGNHIKSARDYAYARSLISEICCGEKHPFFGKHHKEESIIDMKLKAKKRFEDPLERQKISNSLTGKKQPRDTVEKRNKANTGKKRSKEFCETIRKARTGTKASKETREKQSKSKKGKHLSKEHCKHISEGNTGRIVTKETRKKIREANIISQTGKIVSEESKRKNRESHLGEKNHMFGKHHTKEANEKNRLAHTGKKQSEETKEKKRKSMLGKNKGRKHTKEARKHMSDGHKGQVPWNKGKKFKK